jgi:hypothetical protein
MIDITILTSDCLPANCATRLDLQLPCLLFSVFALLPCTSCIPNDHILTYLHVMSLRVFLLPKLQGLSD